MRASHACNPIRALWRPNPDGLVRQPLGEGNSQCGHLFRGERRLWRWLGQLQHKRHLPRRLAVDRTQPCGLMRIIGRDGRLRLRLDNDSVGARRGGRWLRHWHRSRAVGCRRAFASKGGCVHPCRRRPRLLQRHQGLQAGSRAAGHGLGGLPRPKRPERLQRRQGCRCRRRRNHGAEEGSGGWTRTSRDALRPATVSSKKEEGNIKRCNICLVGGRRHLRALCASPLQ